GRLVLGAAVEPWLVTGRSPNRDGVVVTGPRRGTSIPQPDVLSADRHGRRERVAADLARRVEEDLAGRRLVVAREHDHRGGRQDHDEDARPDDPEHGADAHPLLRRLGWWAVADRPRRPRWGPVAPGAGRARRWWVARLGREAARGGLAPRRRVAARGRARR